MCLYSWQDQEKGNLSKQGSGNQKWLLGDDELGMTVTGQGGTLGDRNVHSRYTVLDGGYKTRI